MIHHISIRATHKKSPERKNTGEGDRRREREGGGVCLLVFLSQIKERRERAGVGEQGGVFMYDDDYD